MKKRYWLLGGIILYAMARISGSPDSPAPALPSHVPLAVVAPKDTQPRRMPAKGSPPSEAGKTITPQETTPADYPARFLTGNRVAFREGPSTSEAIIDRFDKGRRVLLVGEQGEWSQVRDELTQREGWLASRFLRDKPPQAEAKQPKLPTGLPEATIIQRIIAESVASYPSSCACPYNRDRGGRRCGRRSAYSKPGGYAPICFPGDVTTSMIEAFRQR